MNAKRRYSGVLLHPSSLPSAYGIGDFGASAYHFMDWLVSGRQSLWQILPLGGLGPGNSPYMSPSAFAGNELLIDLVMLHEAGWLPAEALTPDPAFEASHVDYALVRCFKMERLRVAATRFFEIERGALRDDFEAFCAAEAAWLQDYALFMALDEHYGDQCFVWQAWPQALVRREPNALAEARKTFEASCRFWAFCQWIFRRQWQAIRDYAKARQIYIVGDAPIFVAAHSADVWANQSLFDLDSEGQPRVLAGVPPDYFSETGQLWGNPLYRWSAHEATGYAWWIARMRNILNLCDVVRLDHFRGFSAYWEIPVGEETAVNGVWRPGPGFRFFEALLAAGFPLYDAHHGLPAIIAEDLGVITEEVCKLREQAGFPGMRILQFAFDGMHDNLYLPHNITRDSVVYTGTHDNDTVVGWWSALSEAGRDYVLRYLGLTEEPIHVLMIRTALASVAALAIIPMQDVLALDTSHRMNAPGMPEGCWAWRFSWQQVDASHAALLAKFSELYDRNRH